MSDRADRIARITRDVRRRAYPPQKHVPDNELVMGRHEPVSPVIVMRADFIALAEELSEVSALRAEVERLKFDKAELTRERDAARSKADLSERAAFGWHEEVERLREALEQAQEAMQEVMDVHERGGKAISKGSPPYTEPLMWATYGDRLNDALDIARAALTGSPVETRVPPNAALVAAFDTVERQRRDDQRAMALRVREHLIKALWRRHMKRNEDRAIVVLMESELRALDLDALLEGR